MSGRQVRRPDLVGKARQRAEFHGAVTQGAGVRCTARFVGLNEWHEDVFVERRLQVQYMQFHSGEIRRLLGPRLMDLVVTGFGVQLHIDALDVVPLLFEQHRRHGRIHTAAHPDQHFFLLHCHSEFFSQL